MSPGERWCRHILHGGKGHLFVCNLSCLEKDSCSSGLKPTLRLIRRGVGFGPRCDYFSVAWASAHTVQANPAMQVE